MPYTKAKRKRVIEDKKSRKEYALIGVPSATDKDGAVAVDMTMDEDDGRLQMQIADDVFSAGVKSEGGLVRKLQIQRKLFLKNTIEPLKRQMCKLSKKESAQKHERRTMSREIKSMIEEFDAKQKAEMEKFRTAGNSAVGSTADDNSIGGVVGTPPPSPTRVHTSWQQ
eukprot:TRINITY_DN25229_c0_g1_i1.p1 TRINITY_DN25229_c0_g1~~TRINITY_DN25229_c0_g1_i1.p1  ORF type:complete len:176 (-),score=55.73 TRINITY_DN25229_c0_g1_i1:34-537(-)